MIEGLKLSNFKIWGPNPQNNENRGTKTAIKLIIYYKKIIKKVYIPMYNIC
jgi:hypothetical protein